MILAARYRIYPTESDARRLRNLMILCHALYCAALEQRRDAWNRVTLEHVSKKGVRKGASISRYEQSRQATELREERGGILLRGKELLFAEMPRAAVTDVLIRLERSFDAFFRRCAEGGTPGYPRFPRRAFYRSFGIQWGHGIRLNETNRASRPLLSISWGRGKESRRIDVPVVLHRPLPGRPKHGVVSVTPAGEWYVTIQCDECVTEALPPAEADAGLDMGVSSFAALSDGMIVENPRIGDRMQDLIARDQRRLRLKPRRSKRKEKLRLKIAKRQERVAAQRQDFRRKTALGLLRKYDRIAVEDLRVRNMTASASGSIEEPGTNVRQKAGLNRAILDTAPAAFVSALEAKAAIVGRTVERVDPRGTSQICSGCGAIVRKDLSVRTHECSACGLVLDRDVNAARNILARASFSSGTPSSKPEAADGLSVAGRATKSRRRRASGSKTSAMSGGLEGADDCAQ